MITVSIVMLVRGLLRFSIFPGSVLESYTYIRGCPFLPSCPFYWHIAAHSSLMIVCVVCCHLLDEIGSFLLLYKFQVYGIVTQIFKKLYSVYSYYQMLDIFPVLHNVSLYHFFCALWQKVPLDESERGE